MRVDSGNKGAFLHTREQRGRTLLLVVEVELLLLGLTDSKEVEKVGVFLLGKTHETAGMCALRVVVRRTLCRYASGCING